MVGKLKYTCGNRHSAELKKYAARHDDCCKVTALDRYITKFTFTNRKFHIKNEKIKKEIDANGVVFSMIPCTFKKRLPTETWCNQLDSIAQWPSQHYWFVYNDTPTDDLVVVFREDRAGQRFNVEQFLKDVHHSDSDSELERENSALPGVVAIRTFQQYITKKFGLIEEGGMPMRVHLALDQPGVFSTDDICKEKKDDDDGGGGDSWSLTEKKEKRRKRQQYSEPCPYKFNCRKGSKCAYKHTDVERDFFKNNNGCGNPLRKVKQCSRKCTKPKNQCLFAHGEEDAWCLNCRSPGHFTENCDMRAGRSSSP